jgi:hypothetical protein
MRGLQVMAMLLFTIAIPQEHLNAPPMTSAHERGATIARTKSGQTRWKNHWTMDRTTLDGKPILRFTEEGEGVHSPFTQEVKWTITSTWTDTAPPTPLRSDSSYSDGTGKALTHETRVFDLAKKQVRIESTDSKTGRTQTQTMSVPADTLAIDGIAGILRGLNFVNSGATKPLAAHLLSNEPKLYDITLELRGREKIQRAGESVDCYKVELVPHLGVLNVFRLLYPKSVFWFQVAAPHAWTRYEGLENGPGTPEIVMESSEN